VPRVFSYGTLQDDRVQLDTIGRRLDGTRDELVGFEAVMHGPYRNVRPSVSSRVAGTVYEITDAELTTFDEYEADAAYVRVETTLASGRTAWVYVAPVTSE